VEKTGVVCVGMALADILIKPVDRRILERDVTMVDEISYATGGDAINEAATLARLGVPVKLMGSVGTDMWGDFILTSGAEAGIDMRHVTRRSDLPTTISIVLIHDDGERNFICRKEGTNFHFMMECLDMDSLVQAKVVSLASLYGSPEMDAGMLQAARAASKAGAVVTADMMYLPGAGLDQQAEILPYIDYFFPNYDEAAGVTGKTALPDIAEVFLKYGVKNIVIKTGAKGCYIQNREGSFTAPARKNVKVVDTTGAGDNFAAGFIFGLTRDCPARKCAAYANAAASVSIQYVGAKGAGNVRQLEEMAARELLV
jgi:sugar/nucleoside kinase (ribokinase family)